MTELTHYRFLTIKKVGDSPSAFYRIANRKTGHPIGVIEFYQPWKKWVFSPSNGTIWDLQCLANVLDALKRISDVSVSFLHIPGQG